MFPTGKVYTAHPHELSLGDISSRERIDSSSQTETGVLNREPVNSDILSTRLHAAQSIFSPILITLPSGQLKSHAWDLKPATHKMTALNMKANQPLIFDATIPCSALNRGIPRSTG